jgi:hypothetical protein
MSPAGARSVCYRKLRCGVCRDLSRTTTRTTWERFFDCPPGGPDWQCPHGKPWGWQPPSPPTLALHGHPPRADQESLSRPPAAQASAADEPTTGAAGVAESAAPDTAAAALAGVPMADLLPARLAVCHSCDEFNGATCERRFPRGCCLSSWQAWLAAKASRCPHADGPKWPPAGPAGHDSVHPLAPT